MSPEDNTPEARDTPKKWKASLKKPLPAFRCITILESGDRCGGYASMGSEPTTARCRHHGGQIPAVQEKAAARIEAARMRLVGNLDLAIDTVEALMESGTADAIRLKAAESVMDRAGLRGGFEIDVEVNESDASLQIREKLAKLALGKAQLQRTTVESEFDDDIEDAEIIEDEDEDEEIATDRDKSFSYDNEK